MRNCHWVPNGMSDGHLRRCWNGGYLLSLWTISFSFWVAGRGGGGWKCCKYILFSGRRLGGGGGCIGVCLLIEEGDIGCIFVFCRFHIDRFI